MRKKLALMGAGQMYKDSSQLRIEDFVKRMEQLIQSMLKITRLDSGGILFEKSGCYISDLISHSINELTTKAESEKSRY